MEAVLLRQDAIADDDTADATVRTLYRTGAAAALAVLAVALLEMAITFRPGGGASPTSVTAWFVLLEDNWFMGLRDLGLLNIFINVLGIPTYFVLYVAHRDRSGAAYAAILFFTGVAVFLATNRAFPMLALSGQYAAIGAIADRSVLETAGTALLAVGQSHTAGTFLAFLLTEAAGLMISVVMLAPHRGGLQPHAVVSRCPHLGADA